MAFSSLYSFTKSLSASPCWTASKSLLDSQTDPDNKIGRGRNLDICKENSADGGAAKEFDTADMGNVRFGGGCEGLWKGVGEI